MNAVLHCDCCSLTSVLLGWFMHPPQTDRPVSESLGRRIKAEESFLPGGRTKLAAWESCVQAILPAKLYLFTKVLRSDSWEASLHEIHLSLSLQLGVGGGCKAQRQLFEQVFQHQNNGALQNRHYWKLELFPLLMHSVHSHHAKRWGFFPWLGARNSYKLQTEKWLISRVVVTLYCLHLSIMRFILQCVFSWKQ